MTSPAEPPTETPPPATPRRRGVSMPAWVAAILILLVCGGLGYGAWWLVRPAPAVDFSQYEPARGGNRWAGGGGRGPRLNLPPQTEGVVLNPSGNGSARVNGLQVQFRVANGKPVVVDLTPRVTAPADNVASAARNFAVNNAARRSAAGVTDDQVKQLRQIKPPPAVALTADQQAALLKAWAGVKAADAAGRPAAEKTLLDAMKTIAQGRVDAVGVVHAMADRIRSVLTPDQLAILQKPPVPAPAATQSAKNHS